MMPGGGDTSAILIYVKGQENTRKPENSVRQREAQTRAAAADHPVSAPRHLRPQPSKTFLPSGPCAHPAHTVPVALSGKNEEEKKNKTTMKGKKFSRDDMQQGHGLDSEHLENMAAGWETTSRHTPAAMWQRRRRRLVGPVLQAESGVGRGPPPPQRF